MLLAHHTMGYHRGAADSGFFHFYASRDPHDSKSLHGLRGTKHRLILTLIASRPACLRGTGVDVGDSGGRPLQHRNNRSLRVLWPYHRMVGWERWKSQCFAKVLGSTLGEICLERSETIGKLIPIEIIHDTTHKNGFRVLTKGEHMKPTDVSQDCWEDFLAHRKAKRAIVTTRVINTIRQEAQLAGWTLEQALDHMVLMGWRGFKADWVEKKQVKQDLWSHLTGKNVIDMEVAKCKAIANG